MCYYELDVHYENILNKVLLKLEGYKQLNTQQIGSAVASSNLSSNKPETLDEVDFKANVTKSIDNLWKVSLSTT